MLSLEARCRPSPHDEKREIALRLGYRTVDQEGTGKHDLFGPDGRHRAIFRPSKAADAWVWNDAVFSFELYRHQDGAVLMRLRSAPDVYVLKRIWPEPGERETVPLEDLVRDYERLTGAGGLEPRHAVASQAG